MNMTLYEKKMERIDKVTALLEESKVPSRESIIVKLEEMGYFTAPSSCKHHGAYEGGNCDHSIAVTEELLKLTKGMNLTWQNPWSPYIIGLFHDLCKCDAYIENDRLGVYEYNEHQMLSGHGDKSVMLASQLMTLSEEEMLCIRFHMGAYMTEDWEGFDTAIRKYANVLYTHMADMLASK